MWCAARFLHVPLTSVRGWSETNSDQTSSADCRLLDWDTNFWGFRVATVIGERLAPERVERIDRWCSEQEVRCLYFLADPADPYTAEVANGAGFQPVDVRSTFACPI